MTALKPLRLTLALGTAFVAFPSASFAQDAADFATKLSAAYSSMGYNIEFGPATEDGSTITYDGVTVSFDSPETPDPFVIKTPLTFSGVTKNADGSYSADSLSVPDVDLEQDGAHIVAKNMSVESIYVPASETATPAQMMQTFATLKAGPITITEGGKPVASIESISGSSEFFPEQGAQALESVTGDIRLEGISADLSRVEDPQAKAVIEALDLSTLTGSMTQHFDWSMADGRMQLTDMALTLDNIGTLGMAFDISGYTPGLMSELVDMEKELSAITDETERTSAEEAYGIELLQKISLGSMSVRFIDQSITNRVLDYLASQQGIERNQLVAGLLAVVPVMAGEYGSLPIVQEATKAVSDFLQDPKNLSVTLSPAQPVTFLSIAAASQDPQALAEIVNASVTANAAIK